MITNKRCAGITIRNTTTSERFYTVKKGDRLWSIAKKELGSGARYTEIVALNGLKTATIYSGQRLILPQE